MRLANITFFNNIFNTKRLLIWKSTHVREIKYFFLLSFIFSKINFSFYNPLSIQRRMNGGWGRKYSFLVSKSNLLRLDLWHRLCCTRLRWLCNIGKACFCSWSCHSDRPSRADSKLSYLECSLGSGKKKHFLIMINSGVLWRKWSSR